jgi:hypothetical protein
MIRQGDQRLIDTDIAQRLLVAKEPAGPTWVGTLDFANRGR